MEIELELGKNLDNGKLSQRQIQRNLFNAARESLESTTQNMLTFKLNAGAKDFLPTFQIHVLMKAMTVYAMEEFSTARSLQRERLTAHQSTQSNQSQQTPGL